MRILLLRLEAPLMSFGTVAVDHRRRCGIFPALSMVTGLLGAALGLNRYQTHELQSLQDRLRIASRIDRRGRAVSDYQTVDLSTPWMDASEQGVGWNTHGRVETRGGAPANRTGTHIRLKEYWSGRIATVSLTLSRETDSPNIHELGVALRAPAHPLYLGRRSCPPAVPILAGSLELEGLRLALEQEPRAEGADEGPLLAQWPAEEGGQGDEETIWDLRDWKGQVHAGTRLAMHGLVDPPPRERKS